MRALPCVGLWFLVSCSPARPKPPVLPEDLGVQPSSSRAPVPAPAPAKKVDATPDPRSTDPRVQELATAAAAYINAFTNVQGDFTPDGKRVVFVSNRDGLPQLYVSTVADRIAAPVRLVQTKERVIDATTTSDGKSVVFRSDTGADEHWSIFRVGLDGKDLVELTPGERLNRDEPVLPTKQPATLYFTARKMTEPRSTLYSASAVTPGPAKPIYTDELPTFLMDVAPSGATALVKRTPSRTENYLMRVDVASGKAEQVFPSEGQVRIHAARFSADGNQIYVATDAGSDQTTLLALDAKTGKQLATYAVKPATAEIVNLRVAERGGLVALALAVGNHGEVVLLDGKRLTPKKPVQLPFGQGNIGKFSRDGKRLALSWSSPSSPADILSIDTTTGVVEPLRVERRPSLAAMPDIEVIPVDIPAFDGGKIPTNVYVVQGEDGKPHPTVVIYHGGPQGVSMVRWSPTIAFLLSLGYAVVEPNVRGSSGYGRAFEMADNGRKRLDAIKDIETSARWVAGQPWADKDRLVVYGGSYGGFTVLLALTRWPELWRAGVDLFGVASWKTVLATTSGSIRRQFVLEIGDPEQDAEFLAQISPLTDIHKIVDPTFVYAGANDPRVPRSESDLIVKALRGRGVAMEYMVADNEGHSLSRLENQIEFHARMARFLELHLK